MPKSLYKVDPEGTQNEHENSLYHSISLSKGQVHHVVINCSDPGAVLTWDFDVMRHKVLFSVFHKESSEEKNTLGLPENQTTVEQEITSNKELKEGIDGVMVEASITCHDGESIQGTHIMKDAGTYVLQWYNPEEQSEFLSSAHKAQLMYYYETLPSANYK